MPPKKKVSGYIKLQIQAGAADAGAARRPGARSARRQHHGVRQGVQRRDRVPARQRHPGRDHRLRGPLVHVRHSRRPPAAELIKKAAGVAKGSGEPHKTKVAKLTQDQVREIAEPEDGRPQRQRRRAGDEDHRRHRPLDGRHRPERPTRSAGRWSTAPVAGPALARDHDSTTTQGAAHEAQQVLPGRRREDRAGHALHPARGRPPRQGDQHHQVRRHRRGRAAPRRRPPQGRPDGARHREPAARHRQDRPRPGLRHRRQRRGRHGRRRRLRRLPTT